MGWRHPFQPPDPDDLPSRAEAEREWTLEDEANHLDELDAIAPNRRQLLVCECGVIAKDFAWARCGRDPLTVIRSGCPTRWEMWERVDEVGA